MSLSEEVIDATLDPDGTLRLSHPPHVPPGPVRVTIQSVAPAAPRRTMADVFAEIDQDHRAAGFVGRTAQEIAAWEAEQQAEDEERDRELDAARRPFPTGGP